MYNVLLNFVCLWALPRFKKQPTMQKTTDHDKNDQQWVLMVGGRFLWPRLYQVKRELVHDNGGLYALLFFHIYMLTHMAIFSGVQCFMGQGAEGS